MSIEEARKRAGGESARAAVTDLGERIRETLRGGYTEYTLDHPDMNYLLNAIAQRDVAEAGLATAAEALEHYADDRRGGGDIAREALAMIRGRR